MEDICPNFEFCENTKVAHNEYCMDCGSWFKGGFGWDSLTFISSSDDCTVCMNPCERKLMFPTGCGHSFCMECSRNILFWNEHRYHLSQVPYGCPPCPNDCKNPIKGKQCYCEEYDSILEEWETNNPTEYAKWKDDTEESARNSIYDTVYATATCPLCRKKYVRG